MRRLNAMEDIWRNHEHTGVNKPTIRATITRPQMKTYTYGLRSLGTQKSVTISATDTVSMGKLADDPTALFTGEPVTEVYATHWVHDEFAPRELPNIKSLNWTRSVDQDAAEMTLTMYNVAERPMNADLGGPRARTSSVPGELLTHGDSVFDMDQLGYFSPSRGTTVDSGRWGHTPNDFTGLLMPDNLIKTFQGYGVDWTKEPESDPHMAQTGVWLIDEISFTANGMIEIRARDLGRLLLQTGFEAPVLPNDFNPIGFKAWSKEDLDREVNVESMEQVTVKYEHTWSDPPYSARTRVPLSNPNSSASAWRVGTNGDGGPGTIRDPMNYMGRGPQHTLDDNPSTYWISVGNASPRAPFAYEWVEFDLPGSAVSEVVISTVKAGYNAYVSVMRDGTWLGAERINYREAGVGRNGSNIPFIAQANIPGEGARTIRFAPVDRASKIRITLGNLQNFSANFGAPAFRGALRTVEAYASATHPGNVHTEWRERTETQKRTQTKTVTLQPGAVGENPWGGTARYNDYTDLVKLFCAWGGFYWPQGINEATSNSTSTTVDDLGNTVPALPNFRRYTFDRPDTDVLGHVPGRVWGDFMSTGQSGPNEIKQDNFMAKSLMEGIRLVADTVSFNFWIDEFGAVQWRYPNIDTIGNWCVDNTDTPVRVGYVWDLDEKQLLTDVSTTLSSRRMAEIVVLKDLVGNVGYVSSGYNPNPTGMRRSVIWTDAEYLKNAEEAKIMGDLIATRMLFNYRTNTIVVPGFPGLQVDDQIQLHERTTSDSFYHLITAISSTHDNESGEWTMTLNTMWLGDEPEGRWTVPRRTRSLRESTGIANQPVIERGGRILK